jgi:uncharacterized membrane protein
MLTRSIFTMTFAAALGSGLVAGVFFGFSSFVMPALARIRAEHGIAVMQSMNITVLNPLFMLALFGTAVLALILGINALSKWGQPSATLVLVASALYLVGSIGVTMGGNMPLNNALDAVQSTSADGAAFWTRYIKEWPVWNHIRTLASAASCALYMAAMIVK